MSTTKRPATLLAALLAVAAAAPSRAADVGDADVDGIVDPVDDCLLHANPSQLDTDRDGFGNACDPDFDQDGIVGASDRMLLVQQFGIAPRGRAGNYVRGAPPPPPRPGVVPGDAL